MFTIVMSYNIFLLWNRCTKSVGCRGCEDLKLWRPAVINHLHWTAASTPDGDPNVMEAKWCSMVNHVQDIHEHGDAAFPHCAHPPLEGEAREKEWLEPGTTYYRGLRMYFLWACQAPALFSSKCGLEIKNTGEPMLNCSAICHHGV